MSLYENEKRARSKNVKQWGEMLLSPTAKQVMAPALSPGLTSKATIVKSFDIPYASTDAGAYVAIMSTNPASHYGSTTLDPVVSTTEVKLSSPFHERVSIGTGKIYMNNGIFQVYDDAGDMTNHVPVVENLGLTFAVPALNNVSGIPITIPASTVIKYATNNATSSGHIRVQLFNAAGGLTFTGVARSVGANSGREFTETSPASIASYMVIQWCDTLGNAKVAGSRIYLGMDIVIPLATIGNALGFRTLSVVKSEIIDQFNVTHIRCTGMNMLVTNMAAPIVAGGELVMGRVPIGMAAHAAHANDLMEQIKKLPEKLYWKSTPLIDGGYAWYLPDDLESYEPAPYGETKSDNILVAAVQMANNEGLIRINCTWRYEFYSTAQVLSRSLTRCWSDEAFALFELLKTKPACSENMGHLALIAAAVSTIQGAYEFYKAYQEPIDKGLGLAYDHIKPLLTKKPPAKKAPKAQPKVAKGK